jgi:hypothetical protein
MKNNPSHKCLGAFAEWSDNMADEQKKCAAAGQRERCKIYEVAGFD